MSGDPLSLGARDGGEPHGRDPSGQATQQSPSPTVSALAGECPSRIPADLVEITAQDCYRVTNDALRGSFWKGWEPQPWTDLKEFERELHRNYARAGLAAGLAAEWSFDMDGAPRDGSKVDLMYPYPRGRAINCAWREEPPFGRPGNGNWFWRTPKWTGPLLHDEEQWTYNCYPNMKPFAWRHANEPAARVSDVRSQTEDRDSGLSPTGRQRDPEGETPVQSSPTPREI